MPRLKSKLEGNSQKLQLYRPFQEKSAPTLPHALGRCEQIGNDDACSDTVFLW